MKPWTDVKIDLMLETLREGPATEDLPLIVADIQGAFDAARDYPIEDRVLYRVRCNKLLTCAKIAERRVVGRDLEYLQALEGTLLSVLCKETTK